MIRKIAILLAISCLPVADGTAAGQEALSDQFYGSGVHRYFSGDINAALTDFSAAIQAGTDDPRPYYFRALTWMRMGRSAEAYADLKKGSDLESADINSTYQVSKALERVQGSLRMQLERYRMQARALAQQRQAQERRERYEATRRFDAQQVRRAGALEERQPPAAARNAEAFNEFAAPDRLPGNALGSAPAAAAQPAPLGRGTSAPPAPSTTGASPFGPPAGAAPGAAADGTSPFGQPPAAAAPAANTPPPAAAPAESESPFGGASPFGPAPMPAENNIEKPASPAPSNPPPAAEQPANGGANPFGAAIDQPPAARPAGSPPPAADGGADPFGAAAGEPPAAAPPAASAPAAASPAADSPAAADAANPFGNAAPGAASESPFGGAAPAARPGNTATDADSNPFGPADNNAVQGDASAAPAAPPAADPFGSSNAAPAAPTTNAAGATAAPPVTAASAAQPNNAAAAPNSGGFFRALRRATGIDAAINVAGNAAQSLPVGSRALPAQPNNTLRAGQPVDASTVLIRGAGARAPQRMQPQGNDPLQKGGTPQQPAADPNSDPFQIPPAPAGNTPAADNPFGDAGAPATGAPANPFGAPGGEMPNGPAANTPNPFEDDAVQPAPASGAR